MNPYTTLMTSALLALCPAAAAAGDICENTAKLQKQSAAFELREELKVSIAVCLNLSDPVLGGHHRSTVEWRRQSDAQPLCRRMIPCR